MKAQNATKEQALEVRGKLTQTQFADLMGVSKRNVQHWEAGTRGFTANNYDLAKQRVSRLSQSD